MHALVRCIMAASLLVAAAGWWMKDALPPAEKLVPEVFEEPKQVRVRKPALDTNVNGVDYRIQPRYSYDISALVVSLHHSDTWWDYAHKEWNDHLNLMDLCVVWGGNAQSGAYREISFSNNQWECSWSAGSMEAFAAFNMAEASNNHMVTDDPAVAKALRAIRIGDQVRVRGYLVDYTVFKDGRPNGTRVSSEVRTDTGNGACEVLYVESVDVLSRAGRGWRIAQNAALGMLLLGIVAWFLLPVRADDLR
jgi:hypothetical protein